MVVETMAVMVVLVTVKYPFPVNVSVLFTRRMACSRVSTSLNVCTIVKYQIDKKRVASCHKKFSGYRPFLEADLKNTQIKSLVLMTF
jgi:hypothetical protein